MTEATPLASEQITQPVECEYRKTATIKATQWWEMGDHPAVVMASDVTGATPEKPLPFCPTLEGGHVVTPGDWIATGVQGEHWPIKPDVFASTYEPVDRGSPATRHAEGPSFMADRTWPECLDPNAAHNRRHRIAALSASPAPSGDAEVKRLRAALESVRDDLHNENRLNTLSIADVIWHSEIETTADFIDATLDASPAPSGQGVSGERRCAASPDHADIMETIENAADDWQRKGYTSALAEVRDMANVGRALMEALPEGYSYNDCPSEIVADLQNERDEALAAPAPSCAPGEVEELATTLDVYLAAYKDAPDEYQVTEDDDLLTFGVLRRILAALSPQGVDAKEGGE